MVGWARALLEDLRSFGDQFRGEAPLPTGLHTYRLQQGRGSHRLHLRVHPDGTGVLFVDVTDAVHLNATATKIAHWFLEGIPPRQIARRLCYATGTQDRQLVAEDVQRICSMVQRFRDPTLGCPTCALDRTRRVGLFETPVHAPYKADLAILYDCNNDCPHCYNEPDRLQLESLSLEDWKRVVDKLVTIGVPHLIFTGGEATLYPELPELIQYADAAGPICGLNSNGRRLAHAEYARTLAAAGLNHVQITLGSHLPHVHDRMMNAHSFDQTVRGIQNAMQAGLHTITNTTLMRMNADSIVETVDFLHTLGIGTFAVNGMIYSGGGFATPMAIPEQEMSAILIRIRDRALELGMRFLWYTPTQYCRLSPVELDIGAKRCNAGEYSLCVEPNGDVLPCQSYYQSAGNLLRDPWEKIWRGELFTSFRDREIDPRRHGLPEMCWECPDLPLCGGGCRIEREAAEGLRTCGTVGSCSGCSAAHGSQKRVGGCGSDGLPPGFVDLSTLCVVSETVSNPRRRGTGQFRPK